MKTIKVVVDNEEVTVPEGFTVLQAIQQHTDTEIPVFCYHPKLDIAGNCRMCLVEIEKQPKLAASCAMPAMDGMVISTKSDKVQQARKDNLEFLLVNHPLDCPICDQGGECDLQDITVNYGIGYNNFNEQKRAVPDKYMGPVIKTFMNRCIHCTRCIRFSEKIAGTNELGAISRGEHTEITSYINQSINSELSGNLVDICPVGALTSKPYSYQNRSWELKRTQSIDVLDAVGSNIIVNSHNNQVKRILPHTNDEINECWISDKTRYSCDALGLQRLDSPYIKKNGKLRKTSWSEALDLIAQRIQTNKPQEFAALVGELTDCETIAAIKIFMDNIGSTHYNNSVSDTNLYPDKQVHGFFNTSIQGTEQADFCLLIGANIRSDAAMIHTRLHKRFIEQGCHIAYVGGAIDSNRNFTFPYDDLGDSTQVLEQILHNSHRLNDVISNAKKPMLIVGHDALQHPNAQAILSYAANIAEKYGFITADWNGFNILHKHASIPNSLALTLKGTSTHDIIQMCQTKKIKTIYLLGVDEIAFDKLQDTFIIYQGHHGDKGAENADVILPVTAYTEKNSTYVNTEGRVQYTRKCIEQIPNTKEDWQVIQKLSLMLNLNCPYDTFADLQKCMQNMNNIFSRPYILHNLNWQSIPLQQLNPKHHILPPSKFEFYMDNIISKNSPTMALCKKELYDQNSS